MFKQLLNSVAFMGEVVTTVMIAVGGRGGEGGVGISHCLKN